MTSTPRAPKLGLYYLWNSGCQMNRADASRVAEALEARGYRPTREPSRADLLLLNTCVVRQSAEDRALGRLASLRGLKRGTPDDPALLVMGCLVGDAAALRATHDHVDAFFPPSDLNGVLAYVEAWEARRGLEAEPATGTLPPAAVAELVPISYGCDHRCSYCIVVLRRGAQCSRPVPEIVAAVQRLVERGAREVTLLGQNVDAYGRDLPERPDLADVLEAVHTVPGLYRLRFLTSHPRDLSERIISAVANLPRVCPTWELPVQSGDDEVLRRMARGYTAARYVELVERIRGQVPGSAINTDVIVGFPGEREEQFARTLELVERLRFDVVHVAAYSPRPGTAAARWPDDVSPGVKARRRRAVEQAQERIAGEINAALLGCEVEVLVEGRQKGRWRGRTPQGKLAFFEADGDWTGRLAGVRVTWAGPWSLIGEVVRDRTP